MQFDNTIIDITGNWQNENGFKPHISTSEPCIAEDETMVFSQYLKLIPGRYKLTLEYNSLYDKKCGQTIKNMYSDFCGLVINNIIRAINFVQDVENSHIYIADCEFIVNDDTINTSIKLGICNSRPIRTYIKAEKVFSVHSPGRNMFYGIKPGDRQEVLIAHGIPFVCKKLDLTFFRPGFLKENEVRGLERGSLFNWYDNVKMSCGGIMAKTVHFLGMIHNIDIANGSWYSNKGDNGYSHFVGDKAGEIILTWEDGSESFIPLIFGFNLWYSAPWDMVWHYQDNPYLPGTEAKNYDSMMFCGNDEYRDVIRDNVCLVDGIKPMASWSCNARFIFSVNTDYRKIMSINVKSVDDLYDNPLISAVTFETEDYQEEYPSLVFLPDISNDKSCINPLSLKFIEQEEYNRGLEKIKRVLYTFTDELPELEAPKKPEGYFGPDYDFRGMPEALYAATFLYYNGPECAAHIADSGTSCSSSTARWALHHYAMGMGVWIERTSLYNGLKEFFSMYKERIPGNLPGLKNAWTRGAGELLREATAFGYDKFVDSYINWLDEALFEEANPPHWNRVAGCPSQERAFSEEMVGDVLERGNRENDGHGICMWGRYMVWHWLGRLKIWNESHWQATKAAVEWVQWQLDTDMIRPGIRKDVLYTESECAYGSYDFYSSYNCLHGIKLSIIMAQQLGKTEETSRWLILYKRLATGILKHLTDESEFGLIWHTEDICDWKDHAHKLAHIQLATEGFTYTPMEDYIKGNDIDRKFLEVDINSYNYLMKEKNYNCLRMYGYGQGLMTQAALLMDQMDDAENFMSMLLKHCYLPKFARWTCPEGIILHKSGKYYLPVNGYMGQDSHVAESTKAVRLMLGLDDNDPQHLRLVPRYPREWTAMAVSKYPVFAGEKRQHIDYKYYRYDNYHEFSYWLEHPVDRISVRVGPIPAGKEVSHIFFNDNEVHHENIFSGDSRWVWVCSSNSVSGTFIIVFSKD